MADFKLVTNPVKYKPHYNATIKAEYTEAVIRIKIDNRVAPHCKIGFIYDGIRHYEEEYYVRKNSKIQLFAETTGGYMIQYIYINKNKYNAGILGQDITITYETQIFANETIREYYANFEAALNTDLSYHFIAGGKEITRTLHGGETESYRVPYGTEIDVGYVIHTGYNGGLRKSGVPTSETHFVIGEEDLWLATTAVKKIFTVHMFYPDEAKLEVSYTDDDGVEHYYQTGELADPTKITEYFDAAYGSKLKISVTVNIGTVVTHLYINETIDIPNPSIYELTENISIKALVGIKKNYMVIKPSDKCNNVVLYRGTRYDHRSGTITIRYGDYIYFRITPKDSFKHYVKAVKINEIEYPGLESYQVLEDISVDSVAGDNVFPKVSIDIMPMDHGRIVIFYIDTEYTAEDTPMDALKDYTIQIWIEPDEGYKAKELKINDTFIPEDRVVAYKLKEDIIISGSVIPK